MNRGCTLFASLASHYEGIEARLALLNDGRDKPAGTVRISTHDHVSPWGFMKDVRCRPLRWCSTRYCNDFTGTVRIDPHHSAAAPARVSSASVTFEPGARSAWHTHPLGQTLIVTSGCGWTQCEGEAKVEIRAGDVIWCPPGHKHWHGVTATTTMTHITIHEAH